MKWPDDIQPALRTRWDAQWRNWLGDGGEWPLRFALGAPTESTARAHWEHFGDWVCAWRAFPEGQVIFERRQWPALGTHEVPTHISFDGPEALASALGREESTLWNRASQRYQNLLAAWPECADALRRIAPWIGSAHEDDFSRFVSVVDWLNANPDSGLWLRQLPIPGVHSKWAEANMGPLKQILACRLGRDSSTPFLALAGLSSDPPRRRIRILDPQLRAELGGLGDITLSTDALARLSLPVQSALIVENLQTALAFPDLPGAILLFGAGFSVSELGTIPWLSEIPILYWGDIDNAGFSILNALRHVHPHATSILMDEETLLRHRALWSHDESLPGARLDLLRDEEKTVYTSLGAGTHGPSVRLEQERVDWEWAFHRLTAVFQAL